MAKTITCDGVEYNLVPVVQDKLEFMSVGKNYLVQTVTHYFVGECLGMVSESGSAFAILGNASWVADTGKFSECIKNESFNEVEYASKKSVTVALGAIVAIWPWGSKLPQETK